MIACNCTFIQRYLRTYIRITNLIVNIKDDISRLFLVMNSYYFDGYNGDVLCVCLKFKSKRIERVITSKSVLDFILDYILNGYIITIIFNTDKIIHKTILGTFQGK